MQLIKPRWMVFPRTCQKTCCGQTIKGKMPYFIQAKKYDNGNLLLRFRLGYRVLEIWRVVVIPEQGRSVIPVVHMS